MKKLLHISLAFVVASLWFSTGLAQTANAQTSKDDSLYIALGQKAGIAQMSDDFVTRLVAHPRMRTFFEKTNLPHFELQLADQLCVVSGGPCVYKGADMKSAHANFDIAKTDFNVLVEILQQTMDARGISFREQNRLLALLAPMHREVITVK